MLKIAIILKGPLRCSLNQVVENYQLLNSHFQHDEYEIDRYFFSYNNEKSKEFLRLISNFDYISLTKRVSDETILGRLLTTKNSAARRYPHAIFSQNVYRLFSMNKFIGQFIAAQNINYDFVICSRTELGIKLEKLEEWFDKDKYCCPIPSKPPFPNDCFSISTLDNFVKAWDYHNLEIFNELNEKSDNTENLLHLIITMNNVGYKGCPTKFLWINKGGNERSYYRGDKDNQDRSLQS